MRAARVPTTGGIEVIVIDEVKVPEYGENDLLIDVALGGINFIDTYHRTGLYPLEAPKILGREGAGTVSAIGNAVKGWKKGDHVAFISPGAHAEKVVIPANRAIRVPPEMSLADATASLIQGLTAHYLIQSTFKVQKDDTVLIHAGAGGTGALMIQMAKIRGARVLTTVSTSEKAVIAKAAGADETILYTECDFHQKVMELTLKKGVAVVYDGVGKSTFEKSLKCLQPRGMLVLFGNASGAVPPMNPLILSRNGSIFLTRPTLKDYIVGDELHRRANELFRWILQGKVKLRIAKYFLLSETGEAHKFLESRKALGKVLIRVSNL